MTSITLQIDGMSCQHCVMRVKKALEGLDGVTGVDVTVGQAGISFDEAKIQRGDLEAAVVKAGYKIRG